MSKPVEYPKMPTVVDPITKKVMNLVYKPGHIKTGFVIFANADEEAAFKKADAVPDTGPKQAVQVETNYLHGSWYIDGLAPSRGNR
jgi:hypothetical protein